MMIPRDYQVAGDAHLWAQVHNHPDENPLMIMPTGVGKSLQMAMFVWRMLATYPHVRILNITHVKELVEGNYKTLLKLWPAAPAGVYSAGLNRRDTRAQVTFAGVGSVYKRAPTFGHIDFVVIDEAHRMSPNDATQYGQLISALRFKNPNLMVIGFTATGFRMGSGMLIEDDGLFDSVAFDLSDGEAFVWLIEQGYLIKPVPKHPGFQLDSSDVAIRGGEFDTKASSHAMRDQDILERAVDMTIALGEEQNRQCWLTFCQSIDDAELVADMFRYKGHAVEAVHSKRKDRDDVLAKLKRGELRGVTNKDVLTTGFDHPPIDLITMLRLTRSPGLWVQMLGRGTRPVYVDGQFGPGAGHDLTTLEGRRNAILASPKQTCLVLDFVGNTERLGPINYPVVPRKRKKGVGGEAPVRLCKECGCYNHASKTVCEECGHEFPPPKRLENNASEGELVKGPLDLNNLPPPPPREEEVFPVHRMIAMHHTGRNGKPDTMRVDYFSGVRRFSQWVCFGHGQGTFPRRKAEEWWTNHGGEGTAPTAIDEAVAAAADLNKPKWIKVWVNTKYPEILAHDFVGTRFELPPELGGPPLSEVPPDPTEELRLREENERAKMLEHMASIGGGYDDDIPF